MRKKAHHYLLPLAAVVIVLVVGYVVLFSKAEPLHDGTGSANSTVVGDFSADINKDGQVNILDLSLVAGAYGRPVVDHNPADINEDGAVNVLDLSIVANDMQLKP